MYKPTIKYISLLALCYSSFALAQNGVTQYFLDHQPVEPGRTVSFDYKFPSPQYSIECHQDSPASDLGSVEWVYKGTAYKGQIGSRRSLVLMSDQPNNHEWFTQTADAAGKLTFTNLDKFELQVTCSYQIPE